MPLKLQEYHSVRSLTLQENYPKINSRTRTRLCDVNSNTNARTQVRDVAWAPNSGMMCNTVASCSEDGNVFIHIQDATTQKWSSKTLNKFNYPVWRVSWSVTGHLLAVSAGDNDVTIWKEDIDGKWNQVSAADASGLK